MRIRRHATPEDGVVYFLQPQVGGRVKIGSAHRDRLNERLAEIQRFSPQKLILLAVMPGGQQLEAQLHRRFEHARVKDEAGRKSRGEWFEPVPDLLFFVAAFVYRDGWDKPGHDPAKHALTAARILKGVPVYELQHWLWEEDARIEAERRNYLTLRGFSYHLRTDEKATRYFDYAESGRAGRPAIEWSEEIAEAAGEDICAIGKRLFKIPEPIGDALRSATSDEPA